MSELSAEDRERLEGWAENMAAAGATTDAETVTRALALIDQQGEDRVKATVNLILEILDDYTPDSGLGTARQYVEHSLGTMGAGYRFEELLSAQTEQRRGGGVVSDPRKCRFCEDGIGRRIR